MQELMTRHFSGIPNNNLPGDDFSAYTYQNAFQPKFYEKVYFVKPISNTFRIDITWCLEPMIQVSLILWNIFMFQESTQFTS